MKPTKSKVPKHVGIIMDGNRRFAKRLVAKPWKGHEWGAKRIEDLLNWCKELDIKELTLYAFSLENFHRPKKEFDYLMDLFVEGFNKIKEDKRLHESQIRINFIGRIHLFPEKVYEAMKSLMERTKEYSEYIINFAMAYGGRAEIIDATKKIAHQIKEGVLDIDDINEKVFANSLYMEDEPDMIIRTGAEQRTSNFLNYQAAYAEWFYIEKMWPEFTKEDFVQCIKEYGERDRRFGK